MAEEKEGLFFVGLSDPVAVRRNLLEGSRDTINVLKNFEMIKELRAQKAELTLELKDRIAELNKLVSRCKRHMPKAGLRAKKEETTVVEQPARRAVQVPKSELEKLESELSDIESKLSRLENK